MSRNKSVHALTEGAILIALSLILSYAELRLWYQGGSVDLVMVPLLIYALRWGVGWGVSAGFVFGLLEYFLGNGFALTWTSILLDYSVAYSAVGLAGLFRGRRNGAIWGTVVACFARFVIHFISGITIYRIIAPTVLFHVTYTSPWLYSLVYNGTYMLPNTILAVLVCALLARPLGRYLRREDLS
jgi:thiamine transporter